MCLRQSMYSVGPSDFPDPESTGISCCRWVPSSGALNRESIRHHVKKLISRFIPDPRTRVWSISFSNRSDRFTFEYFLTLKRSGRSESILGSTLSRSARSKGVNRARSNGLHTLVYARFRSLRGAAWIFRRHESRRGIVERLDF